MRSGDLPAYLSLNCLSNSIVSVSDAISFQFSPEIPFLRKSDGQTNRLKDGPRTHPQDLLKIFLCAWSTLPHQNQQNTPIRLPGFDSASGREPTRVESRSKLQRRHGTSVWNPARSSRRHRPLLQRNAHTTACQRVPGTTTARSNTVSTSKQQQQRTYWRH